MTLDVVKTWPVTDWRAGSGIDRAEARQQLERGAVLYFPRLAFGLEPGEERFLTGAFADPKAKNISLRAAGAAVRGAVGPPDDLSALSRFVGRFAEESAALVRALVPDYAGHMSAGPTSLRTQQIAGRAVSWRKDDTRLHVDAFPSNPLQGRRVLRVFHNIDPDGVAREWRVGEPFADFAARFAPRTKAPLAPFLWAMWKLGITKRRRTEYDDRMLQLHDLAKADEAYRKTAPAQDVTFPPGSTWLVFSDQVLHAALSGKCMLEQTIYLDREAILDRSQSPVDVLERLVGHPLTRGAERTGLAA